MQDPKVDKPHEVDKPLRRLISRECLPSLDKPLPQARSSSEQAPPMNGLGATDRLPYHCNHSCGKQSIRKFCLGEGFVKSGHYF